MSGTVHTISVCLWFNDQAEEAVAFYVSIFRNSRVGSVSRYDAEGARVSGRPSGSVMTVEFELLGQPFTALNGGPLFNFSEAISLQIMCDTQKEVDYYWEKLSAGGDPAARVCGWLKDKYGLSWQVIPKPSLKLMGDPKSKKSQRAFSAMLQMKKLDLAALKRAYEAKA